MRLETARYTFGLAAPLAPWWPRAGRGWARLPAPLGQTARLHGLHEFFCAGRRDVRALVSRHSGPPPVKFEGSPSDPGEKR